LTAADCNPFLLEKESSCGKKTIFVRKKKAVYGKEKLHLNGSTKKKLFLLEKRKYLEKEKLCLRKRKHLERKLLRKEKRK
jgi:hypothetical protein